VSAGEQTSPPSAAARCWLCGSAATGMFRRSTLHRRPDAAAVRITDAGYGRTAALRRCRSCGFVFADELPAADLAALYRQMRDPGYQAGQHARRVQMRRLLDAAQASRPGAASLLDVGAGTGLLVAEALARGLAAEGVEPSRWCVEAARRDNGVLLRCGTLRELAAELAGPYDIVMLVDVVEHTADPLGMLRAAAALTAGDGRLVVVTPDIGSPPARLAGRFWWHHRAGHVCYFTRRSMRHALRACGMEAVADRPAGWRFEAAYLAQRLAALVGIGPETPLGRRLGRWSVLAGRQVDLNLHDSRMFIAARTRRPC